MERQGEEGRSGMSGGPANTPPFGQERVGAPGAEDRASGAGSGMGAMGAGRPTSETERELERTRDLVAERAAPVMAEKTQEAVKEAASQTMHDPEVQDQVKRTAKAAQHDAGRMAREQVGKLGGRAETKINEGMQQAADRLETAAERLDRLADERIDGPSGTRARAGDLAHSAADTMESVARYLRDNDAQGLRSDLERQVREKPVQTLLVGVAAGWIAGKILR